MVHPDITNADWFISISKKVGTFGGYELHRYDPDTAEDAKTTAAAPNVIADDVLDWVSRRRPNPKQALVDMTRDGSHANVSLGGWVTHK